jgi:hypothetical protein
MSVLKRYEDGENINSLILIEEVGRYDSGRRRGLFLCPHCTNLFETRISHVSSGWTASCGCIFKGNRKHGNTLRSGYRSSTYKSWYSMIRRCNDYDRYGKKGVVVCDRWKDFNNFLADMGERPSPKHTIDRFPDKKGNYEPGNCRWATPKQQARNLTTNLLVVYNGVEKTLVEWCEILNLDYNRMRTRIFLNGIPAEISFHEKKRSKLICDLIKMKKN